MSLKMTFLELILRKAKENLDIKAYTSAGDRTIESKFEKLKVRQS